MFGITTASISEANGKAGTSGVAYLRTGASSSSNAFSTAWAAISAPNPTNSLSSCTMRRRPVLASEASHRRPIERFDRAKVDHLGRYPSLGEERGGLDREVGHGPVRHDGQVGAGPADGGPAERNPVVAGGIRSLGQAVELLWLEEQDGIGILDR